MSYEYTLPTTGAFFFSSCVAESAGDSVLSIASQHRAQLRDVLKRLKRSSHKDISSVIKCVEDYRPFLAQIYYGLTDPAYGDPDEPVHDFAEIKPLVTSWRATFLGQKIPGKTADRIDVMGIEAEVQFVLLTYAYALSNYAMLPSHESQRTVALLTQAAGIYGFLNANITIRSNSGKTCPELFPELSACLERLTLGEAQLAALTQLQEKASYSVLCRIAIGAADHLSSAIGILGSHPMLKVIPNDFRQHLARRQDYARSKAYYFFAQEQEKIGQVGFALACAQVAESLHKNEETTTLLRVLNKENSQVTFQAVPSREEVQAKLPSGRDFVKVTPFVFAPRKAHEGSKPEKYAGDGAYY